MTMEMPHNEIGVPELSAGVDERTPDSPRRGVVGRFRNRLTLALALGAGLMAAEGATAGELSQRHGAEVQKNRAAVTEQARSLELDAAFLEAEADYVRLEHALAEARVSGGLTKGRIGFKATRLVGSFKLGTTTWLDRYDTSAATPEHVRAQVREFEKATEKLAELQLARWAK